VAEKVQITSDGIRKNLKSIQPADALCEYIWNGFDAEATTIRVSTSKNSFGKIDSVSVSDNGHGISYEELKQKFKPYNDSSKQQAKATASNHTLPHGKNGVGRFTFCRFADHAEWVTVYQNSTGEKRRYMIMINSATLDDYDPEQTTATDENCGTTVRFFMVQGFEDDQQVLNIVRNEFAWFIALNEINDFQIFLNDEPIDFKAAQLNEFTVETTDWDLKQQYVIRLVLWKKSLGDEFSRFYFIDSMGKEAYKKTTTFNKKSDEYYHSVYIQSSYFNDFIFDPLEVSGQTGTFPTRSDEEFKLLMANINDELAQRRKAFLNDKKDK